MVRRLLDSPYPLRAVLGVPARVDDLAADLSTVDAPVDVASADTMAAVVGFHVNRGVLAAADRGTRARRRAWLRPAAGRLRGRERP